MTLRSGLGPLDLEEGIAGRIVLAARAEFAARGYSGLTMDGLAHELGISKKTIYAHFASKEMVAKAVVTAVAATIRRRASDALAEPNAFKTKFRDILRIIAEELTWVSTSFLRDVERHAPAVYAEIDILRSRNIGDLFGRLLAEGVEQGLVHPRIDPKFAVTFWVQAIQGLMHPANLERLGLDPREAFERAATLFLEGLLTKKGCDDGSNEIRP
jgi:AcrR family transcriptional regulator